jgi:hypothetical protein
LSALVCLGTTLACSGREGDQDARGEDRNGFHAKVDFSNMCPEIESHLLLPHDLDLDAWADASVTARDQDDAREELHFSWTATAGTFSDPVLARTRYRCDGSGPQLLTVTVSDPAGCERRLVMDIECLSPAD